MTEKGEATDTKSLSSATNGFGRVFGGGNLNTITSRIAMAV